jgi:hypothetical protein
VTVACAHCGKPVQQRAEAIRRALREGKPLYCDRACAGLARRRKVPITPEEAKAAKAEYDRQRRERLAAEIKAYKAEHHKRTYDPVKAAEVRKARMPQHVEYCRRPEYKVKKAEYDKRKRFEAYGPFADAAMLLDQIEQEISTRATRYEIYIANGRFTRSAQQRRRELWQTIRSNRT